jgi:lipid-binding SYLF domain-containing protein
MQRRHFMLKTAGALAVGGLTLAGCSTTATTPQDAHSDAGSKRAAINSSIDSTLARLYTQAHGSHELIAKARGILVFPSIIAAGFGVGGQYGEGALRINGATTGYYSTATASIGFQIGAQSKALILLFMTQDALDKFRGRDGWSVGADASVAVLNIGANGNVDTTTATAPVEAFVLTNNGLMAGVSLEGTKVSRLKSL